MEKALGLAREQGLDLVEVAPDANPVVCKIVNYGKYRYQQGKREKKQQKAVRLKEVKFTIQTGEHDFQTKLTRIREFLEGATRFGCPCSSRGARSSTSARGGDPGPGRGGHGGRGQGGPGHGEQGTNASDAARSSSPQRREE